MFYLLTSMDNTNPTPYFDSNCLQHKDLNSMTDKMTQEEPLNVPQRSVNHGRDETLKPVTL